MQASANWACSIINHGQLLIGSAFPTKSDISYDLHVSCSRLLPSHHEDETCRTSLAIFPLPNERPLYVGHVDLCQLNNADRVIRASMRHLSNSFVKIRNRFSNNDFFLHFAWNFVIRMICLKAGKLKIEIHPSLLVQTLYLLFRRRKIPGNNLRMVNQTRGEVCQASTNPPANFSMTPDCSRDAAEGLTSSLIYDNSFCRVASWSDEETIKKEKKKKGGKTREK